MPSRSARYLYRHARNYVCFASFVAVSASVSCKVSPRLSVGVYYARMSANCCRLFYHYKRISYRFRFGSRCWFGWLLPVVLSHRHTAQTLFSAVVTCKVYPVHAERRTADPICHYCTATAVVYYCAGRTLNPIYLLAFSRGRRPLFVPRYVVAIRSGVCAFVPFDIAKVICVFAIFQTKRRFSA